MAAKFYLVDSEHKQGQFSVIFDTLVAANLRGDCGVCYPFYYRIFTGLTDSLEDGCQCEIVHVVTKDRVVVRLPGQFDLVGTLPLPAVDGWPPAILLKASDSSEYGDSYTFCSLWLGDFPEVRVRTFSLRIDPSFPKVRSFVSRYGESVYWNRRVDGGRYEIVCFPTACSYAGNDI